MNSYELIILAVAIAASSIIKNGAAVGSGIFLVPVLALVFPPKIALGLGAPIMLASDIMGLRNYWGEWRDKDDILRIIAAGSVGIFIGAYFISVIPAHLFKIGIGVFAIVFSIYQLFKDARSLRLPQLGASSTNSTKTAAETSWIPIGILGGVATVLAHAGGMIWSTYFIGKKLDKRCLVATLILLFAISNLIKILTYMKLGILTMESNLIVLAMTPVVIISSNLGNKLNKRLNPELFRKIVLILIMAVGINLLVG